MADMKEKLAGLDTRKKVTIGVFVVIVAVIVWQVMGLFGGGGGEPVPEANVQAAAQPSLPTPKAAPVAVEQPAQVSQEEQEMQRVLKETQARYIAAVNEVQLMKVAQDMADINAKIMKSKEDTVTSQKKIVDMLTQPDSSTMPQQVSTQTADGQLQPGQAQAGGLIQKDVTYNVVSISQLQGKWGAVLSYASNLYSVHVGDVLPADNSSVVSIDKSNVVLEKDGVRTKISMVSVI